MFIYIYICLFIFVFLCSYIHIYKFQRRRFEFTEEPGILAGPPDSDDAPEHKERYDDAHSLCLCINTYLYLSISI